MSLFRWLCFAAVALTVHVQAWAAPDPETIKTLLEQQTDCGQLIRFDDHFVFMGFNDSPGKIRVLPLNGSQVFELSTQDSPVDLLTDGTTAYVLTTSSVEEWDLTQKTRIASYPTYTYGRAMEDMEHARAFARFGRDLIIAHGRLGVSFFNMDTKRIINQFSLIREQAPLESMATGVAVQGNTAYVVMDNYTLVPNGKPAFRGIVTIDMPSETVVAQMDGMDPGASNVVADGKSLIVSFMGQPIWKYSLTSLGGSDLPEPALRLFKFPVKGHPYGAAAMDAKYYYTCYLKPSSSPVPMALNRAQLLLD